MEYLVKVTSSAPNLATESVGQFFSAKDAIAYIQGFGHFEHLALSKGDYRRVQILQDWSATKGGVFFNLPVVKSVVVFVAEYWNDEAADEVHVWFLPSIQENPNIATMDCEYGGEPADTFLGKDRSNPPDTSLMTWDYEEHWPLRLNPLIWSSYQSAWCLDRRRPCEVLEDPDLCYEFAAVCSVGDQERSFKENYSPYAIIHRDGSRYNITIIGSVQRPELEKFGAN
jgi:hypothetical protein